MLKAKASKPKNKKAVSLHSVPSFNPLQLLVVALLFAFVGVVIVIFAYAAQNSFSAPASIAADCSKDVTNQLQNWVNSVPDNSTLVFPANACYRIDNRVTIANRHDLTFEGNNTTFKAFTDGSELCSATNPDCSAMRTRCQWVITGGSNITMRDMIVRGANPNAGLSDAAYDANREAQNAYTVGAGANGVLLDHVQAYDVYGDFVYLAGRPNNVTVRNSTFARDGRQGWTVASATNVLFDHNSVTDTRRSTIDMEPNIGSDPISNVTFSNNDFGPGRFAVLSNNGGAPNQIDGVSFLFNHLHNRPLNIWAGSDARIGKNYKVIGNTVDGDPSNSEVSQSGYGALQFYRINGVEARDNVFGVQPARDIHCVGITSTQNVAVTGNKCTNATGSLAQGDTNSKNVCTSGNYIGFPLRLEPSLAPCAPLSVTILGVTNGATVHGVVNLNASATNGTQPYKHVQYFVNGKQVTDVTVSLYGAPFAWNTTSLANGAYSLTATVFDSANHTATSPAVHITVDSSSTQPPNPSNIPPPPSNQPPSPFPDNTFTGLPPGVTAEGIVNLHLPGNLGGHVMYLIDGKPLASSQLDTSTLSNGDHTITAVVTDANGNQETYSSKIHVRHRNWWQRAVDHVVTWRNHFFNFLYRRFSGQKDTPPFPSDPSAN